MRVCRVPALRTSLMQIGPSRLRLPVAGCTGRSNSQEESVLRAWMARASEAWLQEFVTLGASLLPMAGCTGPARCSSRQTHPQEASRLRIWPAPASRSWLLACISPTGLRLREENCTGSESFQRRSGLRIWMAPESRTWSPIALLIRVPPAGSPWRFVSSEGNWGSRTACASRTDQGLAVADDGAASAAKEARRGIRGEGRRATSALPDIHFAKPRRSTVP